MDGGGRCSVVVTAACTWGNITVATCQRSFLSHHLSFTVSLREGEELTVLSASLPPLQFALCRFNVNNVIRMKCRLKIMFDGLRNI